MIECDAPVSEDEAFEILRGYLADPSTVSQLRFWMSNQRVASDVIDTNLTRVDNLLAMVEEALVAH